MDGRRLQMVGTMGILKESMKVLACGPKLFMGLTMALIVPMCVVMVCPSLITEAMMSRKSLAIVAYLLLAAFFLLSTSAIVYAVASIYNNINTSCRRIFFTDVPRVSNRLFFTFLWGILFVLCFFLIFDIVLPLALFCLFYSLGLYVGVVSAVLNWFTFVSVKLGVIYMECVWSVGSAVTVLEEDAYGMEAIITGVRLMRGRKLMAFTLGFIYNALTFGMRLGFDSLVEQGEMLGLSRGWRVAIGVAIIAGQAAVHLMGMIMQTVIYMACKAHHRERIDLPAYHRI